ncbi:MAG: TonB-dependent receptor [Bacteroidia bacterium]|nr:TonB-dependent receptor [Bacteroidia bacterium]
MILKIHRHKACDLNFIKIIILFGFILSTNCFAQKKSSVVSLVTVEVTTNKNDLSQIGKKTEAIDSIIKQQFKLNSIGDVLSLNTPIFIKNYGPGQLATTAFRGGNASQTAILWNGFNVQNAMLGQSDLSLMPSFLFEDIGVEYGGSSSLWGSGAVGGSIHLKSKTLFNQGFKTYVGLGGGSFGVKNINTGILYSGKRFISSSKIYNSLAQNNYAYKDTSDKEPPVKYQKNAAYNFIGFMQELKFLINARQNLSVNSWVNVNKRRLPAFNASADSKTYQYDNATRISANWSYINSNFRSVVKAAFFEDRINYTDSLTSLFSKSKTHTIIAENENYINWHHHQLNFGLNYTSSKAFTSNYDGTKTLDRFSFLIGNRFSLMQNKWLSYVSARAEYFSVGKLPITGNLSTEYNFTKYFSLMASTAKVYRQPTLNELYWLPGGNINLKPEQGYTFEGSANYKTQINNFSFFVAGAVFSRKINNWILWVPGADGNPSPINLQHVWSRGTETTWKITYVKDKFVAKLNVLTAYVLSTIEADKQENSNTVNKQLIYTPRYTVNANMLIGYNKAAITFYDQYIGYRFTTSDNSQWLNPYQIASLRLNYSIDAKFIDLILFAACNNLFNKSYTILSGRPMPLRNYEFGITLQSKNRNK